MWTTKQITVRTITVVVLGLLIAFVIGTWMKNRLDILTPVLFGIAAASVFGAIDALFFLTAEEELDSYFAKWGVPSELVPLIVGAISASISIYIAGYVEHYLGKRFDILSSPALDVIGILTGTFLISVGYIFYTKWKISVGQAQTVSSKTVQIVSNF